MEIDLSNVELFETLLEFNIEGINVDLHNDYELKSFNLLNNNDLRLVFLHNTSEQNIFLIFTEIEFVEFELPILSDLTLDNFYRGRYEYESKLFDEFNEKKCFYIEFCGVGQLNLLCSKVILDMNN
ncbi:hypothetical protein NLG42_09170 [Flavobacterium plurextorum]|uniref:hypothetical protein n=1 Tax=Flavobacterium TaxID=237 RepID=UPI00214D40D5|nr:MULTISPECIES: hypothetical protein [Flavobacterium]UUW10971.1 hypothetical protein NLG42_09170 [Flavobacterium plurextorum]